MTAVETGERRIEWLDFLRGAASFAVVLFHVRVTLWVGWRALTANADYPWLDRALAWLAIPFPFFGTTVMLFFVVSGFAIHYPYARPGSEWRLSTYALRRFFRIYPAYLVAVVLTLAAEYVAAGLGQASLPSNAVKVGASAAMAQNYIQPAGQMVANPSLWSLPVEVELYLLYPALCWFWRRTGTAWMLAGVSAVSFIAAALVSAGYDWPMNNFARYWIIWTSGAVLAQQWRTGTLPAWRPRYWLVVVGGVMVAVIGRTAGLPVGYEHFLWGGVYFVVVLWGLHQSAPLRHVPVALRRAVLFLGDISYSLYLVHFPVFVVTGALWISAFGGKPSNLLIPLTLSLLPVPVAYLLWRWVERPSQSLARSWSLSMSAPSGRALLVPREESK